MCAVMEHMFYRLGPTLPVVVTCNRLLKNLNRPSVFSGLGIIHSRGSRGELGFSSAFVSCLSVYPHDLSKRDADRKPNLTSGPKCNENKSSMLKG